MTKSATAVPEEQGSVGQAVASVGPVRWQGVHSALHALSPNGPLLVRAAEPVFATVTATSQPAVAMSSRQLLAQQAPTRDGGGCCEHREDGWVGVVEAHSIDCGGMVGGETTREPTIPTANRPFCSERLGTCTPQND